MTASDGNISARLDRHRILVTPAGVAKGRLRVQDLLVMDLDARILSAEEGLRPTTELAMHLEAYRQRPDIGAVIHAHPVFATALTVAGLEFPADILAEVLLTLGEVPVTPYAMPSSNEDAEAIRELIQDHDGLLLRHHGSLTVGKTVAEALFGLQRIEHAAEVFWCARQLGEVQHLPPAEKERLMAARRSQLVR
jgi:L-fuculose-phosphate aldolase